VTVRLISVTGTCRSFASVPIAGKYMLADNGDSKPIKDMVKLLLCMCECREWWFKSWVCTLCSSCFLNIYIRIAGCSFAAWLRLGGGRSQGCASLLHCGIRNQTKPHLSSYERLRVRRGDIKLLRTKSKPWVDSWSELNI